MENIIELTVILFISSMVSEKFADFMKNFMSEKYIFGRFGKRLSKKYKWLSQYFYVGDTRIKNAEDDEFDTIRAYRILKINIFCGIVVAAFLKIDLVYIFQHLGDKQITIIGWQKICSTYKEWYDWLVLLVGIIMSGFFLGLGSKFWHDLLDMLYQVKNAKRIMNDPETYKADTVAQIEKIYNTYQSDFITAAYNLAKAKYMLISSVKAISLNHDDYYYFEITVDRYTPEIDPAFVFQIDKEKNITQSIPIKIVLLEENDKIVSQDVNLSSKIFTDSEKNFGTLGVLVQDKENKKYILTCCHNVFNPQTEIINEQITDSFHSKDKVEIELGNNANIRFDKYTDTALIELKKNTKVVNDINTFAYTGKIKKVLNEDAAQKLPVRLYGAKSGAKKGVVQSAHAEVKVWYDNKEFLKDDLIKISNNNIAVSQGGDSGTCVVDENGNVIGLVVAGNKTDTYVMPIDGLLKDNNVELIKK
jgi:hypothetical protein